jgi:hypothetical protein
MQAPWANGQKGDFYFPIAKTITSWSVAVTFDKAITTLYVYTGDKIVCSSSKTECSFSNQVIFSFGK